MLGGGIKSGDFRLLIVHRLATRPSASTKSPPEQGEGFELGAGVGYESRIPRPRDHDPDELPGCPTPHQGKGVNANRRAHRLQPACSSKAGIATHTTARVIILKLLSRLHGIRKKSVLPP